ncbi:DNA replication complex subunit Gins51 [Haladaptatus sp. DFWS20]|uniref:DNA replication complex subunit Gins51 n=1 Tax=Haladaptatus sp. DFWS20 TaxID=3403467 RepID=UPI003EB74643
MNLDELRSVQSKERSKDSLQHLRESFYADVGSYICDLREERERAAERADDPFDSAEVNRLTDEIQTAEEVVEAIYERRVGKVVKRASLAAAGIPADEEGLTNEEQTLFADLVDRIEANKSTVLDVLAGTESTSGSEDTTESETTTGSEPATEGNARDSEPTESTSVAEDDRPSAEAAAIAGSTDDADSPSGESPNAGSGESPNAGERASSGTGEETESAPEPALSEERTTVRITRDIGEILGVDERAYDLTSEDVVSLPAENAGPLIEREAAEKLD